MSKVYTFSVLLPTGRKVSVKVNPFSTILQVLEDICKENGLDPLEYDMRHHTRILDTAMTVEFSRLINNAQLEMVKAKAPRKESEVVVSLQTEASGRLCGTFLPTESLWGVITKLHPLIEDGKQPAILYMRQEIRGVTDLQATTLRTLGLTGGNAMLRFMNRIMDGSGPSDA